MPIENNNALDFKTFFLLYKDKVYKYAYLHLKEEPAAADLVQETFSRIWKKWAELDRNKNPQSYLYTIARNLVFDELRKQKIRFQFQASDAPDKIPMRWRYPSLEYNYNSANLDEAMQRQYKGNDEINQLMWLLK